MNIKNFSEYIQFLFLKIIIRRKLKYQNIRRNKNILLKISFILEKINIMYIHQFNVTICILKKKNRYLDLFIKVR